MRLQTAVAEATGADMGAALVAALGALSGPLHGGASSRCLETLDAIATSTSSSSDAFSLLDCRHWNGSGRDSGGMVKLGSSAPTAGSGRGFDGPADRRHFSSNPRNTAL